MLSTHTFYIDGNPYSPEVASKLKGFQIALDKACSGIFLLKTQQFTDQLPFLTIPYETDDLIPMRDRSKHIQNGFSDVVVLGTGGSSLGAQALVSLVNNDITPCKYHPRLHFPDNLSPHIMDNLVEGLELTTTHFVVISKSGETAETIAQFLVSLEAIKAVVPAANVHNHFTAIVQPGTNPLRKLAITLDFPVLNHPAQLGGRFSVLSVVGLFPALLAGMDILAIRTAAKNYMEELFSTEDLMTSPVVLGASFAYYLNQIRNVGISFMMPYDSRLIEFSRWHQQLWAESLGKDGKGLTPVRSVGPLDQHSQLQLLLDGPYDKFITILTKAVQGQGPMIKIPAEASDHFSYLNNRTIGDLVQAEAMSTINVLVNAKRPVRHISLKELTAPTIGKLLIHFMVETALTAHMFDVNAYNQPAVELGKTITKKYLAELAM